MTPDIAQAFVRFVRHIETSAVQSESTLNVDLRYLIASAEKSLGIVISVDKGRILSALALLAGPS
jgi:hypothetical protein